MNAVDDSVKALFLDLSGVLYEGNNLIPGASEAVEEARNRGLHLRFVTNTATKSSAQVLEQLVNLGIPAHLEELFTAPAAAKHLILEKQWRPYCLIHPAIQSEFSDINQENPNCVLLGDARDQLCYDSLNRAFRLCLEGAPLIGIGMNRYFKDADGIKLDAGPFIRAVEWAAGTKALIAGKPGRAFFDGVVASTPFSGRDCLMIGDDVDGDVLAAVDAGLRGILVETGKFREPDRERVRGQAEVIPSIADLFEKVAFV